MDMDNSIIDTQRTMNAGSKRSIRQLRGWMTLCGWCSQLVMWEALGIFWNVWSLQQQLGERDFLAVIVAFSAFVSLASSFALLNGKYSSKVVAGAIAPSLPRLRFTAIMRSVVVVILAIGWIVSAHMRAAGLSLVSSASVSRIAQMTRYLGHVWLTTAIGLALVVASLLVQPSIGELKPYERFLMIGSDVSTVILVSLLLKNTFITLELIFLHITIADVLLSKTLGQMNEYESQDDEGWAKAHQKSL